MAHKAHAAIAQKFRDRLGRSIVIRWFGRSRARESGGGEEGLFRKGLSYMGLQYNIKEEPLFKKKNSFKKTENRKTF
jgi:hypothetical protein